LPPLDRSTSANQNQLQILHPNLRRLLHLLTVLIGAIANAGLPPFAGFFSKDSIIEAVHLANVPGAGFAYLCALAAVFVGGLYSFRLVYPSGQTSLLQSATTRRLQLTVLTGTAAADGLHLAVRFEPAVTAASVACAPPDRPPVPLTFDDAGVGRTVLPSPPPSTADLRVLATLPSGDEIVRQLGPVLQRQAATLARRLHGPSLRPLLDEAVKCIWKSPNVIVRRAAVSTAFATDATIKFDEQLEYQRQGEAIATLLTKGLTETASSRLAALDDACPVSHLILGTRLLPLAARLDFDRALAPFVAVHAFAAHERAPLSILPLPDRGSFAFDPSPLPEPITATTLLDRGDDPLDLGVPVPFKSAVHDAWRGSFDVADLDTVQAAELFFEFKIADDAGLGVVIDGEHLVTCFAHRGLVPDRDRIYQRIPVDALHEGRNDLTLQFELLAGGLIGQRLRLLKVVLRLQRPPR